MPAEIRAGDPEAVYRKGTEFLYERCLPRI